MQVLCKSDQSDSSLPVSKLYLRRASIRIFGAALGACLLPLTDLSNSPFTGSSQSALVMQVLSVYLGKAQKLEAAAKVVNDNLFELHTIVTVQVRLISCTTYTLVQ